GTSWRGRDTAAFDMAASLSFLSDAARPDGGKARGIYPHAILDATARDADRTTIFPLTGRIRAIAVLRSSTTRG
ncbi:MAG: hypothetical protein M3N47_12330, partial [Chloroflexota bacterium]|nr:hypothetical protein [Chloroflexota bacterium]